MSIAEERTAREQNILDIIGKNQSAGHVAIWYIIAIIRAHKQDGIWLKFRKDGKTLDRRDNISRLVDDLRNAIGYVATPVLEEP